MTLGVSRVHATVGMLPVGLPCSLVVIAAKSVPGLSGEPCAAGPRLACRCELAFPSG